jgi:hypothetical protein
MLADGIYSLWDNLNMSTNTKYVFGIVLLALLAACAVPVGGAPTFTPIPLATIKVEPTLTVQTEQTPTITAIPSDTPTSPLGEICPKQIESQEKLENRLIGVLIYGNGKFAGRQLYLPDFTDQELPFGQNKTFAVAISSNNNFLGSETTSYDGSGAMISETLDILTPNLELVKSQPWHTDWVEMIGWAKNNQLIIKTFSNNLAVVDIEGKIRQIAIGPNDSDEKAVIAYSPSLETVAYDYTKDVTGPNVRMDVWSVNNQEVIWSTNTLYNPALTDVAWAHEGTKFAISTLPNKIEYHSEILILSNRGDVLYTTNFRHKFKQIKISDFAWSLDDQNIFFWATYDENVDSDQSHLFKMDLSSGTIEKYCFIGEYDKNTIIWLPDDPGFFITRSMTTFSDWDVLLVNLNDNTAYKIGENFSPIGWLRK